MDCVFYCAETAKNCIYPLARHHKIWYITHSTREWVPKCVTSDKIRIKKMAKKVPSTKSEIMAAIAEAAGISKKQAVAAYEALLKIAYDGAKLPKGIVLPGLGKLLKFKSKARTGRNPATGEAIKIPARTKAKFRLAKACKDAVLA